MSAENDHLLLNNWHGSPAEVKETIHTTYYHSCVVFDVVNKSITMRDPALITRRHVPKHDGSSHPPTIFGKNHELASIYFKSADLKEHADGDFPEDLLRNWVVHVSPAKKGDHVGTTLLLLETPLD